MQQFSSLLSWRLFTAQHVSGVFPPIIRSSVTALEASGFTYFHNRYCIVNLQLKRNSRYCFAEFTVTIKLMQSFCYLYLKLLKTYIQLKDIICVTFSYHSWKPYYIGLEHTKKFKSRRCLKFPNRRTVYKMYTGRLSNFHVMAVNIIK